MEYIWLNDKFYRLSDPSVQLQPRSSHIPRIIDAQSPTLVGSVRLIMPQETLLVEYIILIDTNKSWFYKDQWVKNKRETEPVTG